MFLIISVESNGKQSVEPTVKKNVSVSDPITAAVELSKEKVAKWIDNNNDTLEKIRIETAFEFKSGETSLGPSYLSNQIASAVKYGVNSDVFSSSEPITSPSQKHPPLQSHNYYGQHVRFIQIHPGATASPHQGSNNMMYPAPVQFLPIGNQPMMTNGGDPGRPYMIHIPTTQGNRSDPVEPANNADNPVETTGVSEDASTSDTNVTSEEASAGDKRPSTTAPYTTAEGVKPEKVKKPERSSGGVEVAASFPAANGKETYEKHLSQVQLSLVNGNLWEKFYKSGTEMILTRTGR